MVQNIILGLMVVVGGLSKIYKRFIPVSLGIELKTFFTIVIAVSLGAYPAMVCASLMVLIAAITANRYCHWILIKIFVYSVVSIVASVLGVLGVVAAGRVAVIFLNLFYIGFNVLLSNYRIEDMPGNIINVIFTFFLLQVFGAPLVRLLG